LGAHPTLRRAADGSPFQTDAGNFIIDCTFDTPIAAPSIADMLDHVVGVVEHGLFIGLTSEVHVAELGGVRVVRPNARR
jgi:ribose 5-phosphate isomerase A